MQAAAVAGLMLRVGRWPLRRPARRLMPGRAAVALTGLEGALPRPARLELRGAWAVVALMAMVEVTLRIKQLLGLPAVAALMVTVGP